MAKIKTLYDNDLTEISPKTVADAVIVNEEGKTLTDFYNKLEISNSNYITARELGILPNEQDKETENSLKLQNFLMSDSTINTIQFEEGTYYLSNIEVNFSKDKIFSFQGIANGTAIQDNLTIIKTNGNDFIKDTSNCSVRINAKDIHFTSINQLGKCFYKESSSGEFNFYFDNVYIGNFDTGFESPYWSCGGSGGINITFYNNRNGAIMGTSSHLFYAKNLSLNTNRLGIDFKNGGNNCTIENVHIALGYAGSDRDEYTEFIGIHTNGALIINGLYREDYVGNDAYQASKHIAVDFTYKAYGIEPLIINNISIEHGEGTKNDKTIRYTQLDINNNPTRFFTDKLILNNFSKLDTTALQICDGFEQLGIRINNENMYTDVNNNIVLFNRKHYIIEKNNYTLKKGFAFNLNDTRYNRIKLDDTDELAKQNEIFYSKRINKNLIPIYSEFISVLFTPNWFLKIKMNIFTENNQENFINFYLYNYQTKIMDIKALKTSYGYEINFEKYIIAPNDDGFNYLELLLEESSSLWNSSIDYQIEVKQIGPCRNR